MNQHSPEEAELVAALYRRATEILVRPDIDAVLDTEIDPPNITPEPRAIDPEKAHPMRSARVLAAAAAVVILGGLIWTLGSSEPSSVQVYAQQTEQRCRPFEGTVPAGDAVVVEWLPAENCSIELRDRAPHSPFGDNQSHVMAGDTLTIDMQVAIGWEGTSDTFSLTLRDTGDLPEFVSLAKVHTPYLGDPDPVVSETEITPDRVTIDSWNFAEGKFSGHVLMGPEITGLVIGQTLTFFIDDTDDSDLARWVAGGAVPTAELQAALTSNERDRELDALHGLDASYAFKGPIWTQAVRYEALTDVVPELLNLLDGGTAADVNVAYKSARLLSEATQPTPKQWTARDHYSDRSTGFGFVLRFTDPVSAFMPFDPTDQGQVDQTRANWQQVLTVGADRLPRTTSDGEALPRVTDQARELAGSYWQQPSCVQEEWAEPCGISLTLFCNGNAMWNEGNVIVTAAWALLDGDLVFSHPSAELADIVDIDDGHIYGMRRVSEYSCR